MTRIALGILAAGVVAAGSAAAQPVSGLYVGAGVGGNYREATLGENPRNRFNWGWGWVGTGSLGWGFGNGFRVEGEVSYRDNRATGASRDGVRPFIVGGTVRQLGLMANAFYDLPLGDPLGAGVTITPYVGAGVGAGWVQGRNVRATFPNAGLMAIDNASGWDFAYQAIGGVAFGLGQFVPGLSLTTEYRYYATLSTEYRGANRDTGGTVPTRISGDVANNHHSVLVGLRYAFNTPTPAPAPAPAAAPAPARTFLVFFDWDRADLTDRARQIIAEAANNARTVGSTRIEVSGHADRTGSAAYNQRLSVRRAEAVAAELVRRGIARNQITVQGFGFDRPLVPTAMGVREPQNRRVEIVLR
ncbi:MAG: OmpA family protein [Roseococcus sp.]|jgi:outer membrane protein OmpA-like peptidoglycan-associated protein